MGKSSDSSPTPSPESQATAQMQVNQNSALWNKILNSSNYSNPFGASTWTWGTPTSVSPTGTGTPVRSNAMTLPGYPSNAMTLPGYPSTSTRTGTGTVFFDGGSLRTDKYGAQAATPTAAATQQISPSGALYTSNIPQFSNTQGLSKEGMDLYNLVFKNPSTYSNADLATQAQALTDATYQLGVNQMQPQMTEQDAAFAQAMASRGIPVGSELWNNEKTRMERTRQEALNNLALQSVSAGRNEQSRLFNQDLASKSYNAGLMQNFMSYVPSSNSVNSSASPVDMSSYYKAAQQSAQQAAQANSATASTLGQIGGSILGNYLTSSATPTLASAVASGAPLTSAMFDTAAGTGASSFLSAIPGWGWALGGGLLLGSLFDN